MEFQTGNESLTTNVSEIGITSKPSEVFLAHSSAAWDPLVSLSQAQTFGGSSMVITTTTTNTATHNEFCNAASNYPLVLEENHHPQGMSSSYMPLEGMVHKVGPISYGSGTFSDMVGSFCRPGGTGDIGNMGYHRQSYNSHIGKDAAMNEQSQVEDHSIVEEGAAGSAPPGGNRRKRALDHCSDFSPNKNAEGDEMKDSPRKSSDGAKEHEKKSKAEQNKSADLHGKQPAKKAKDGSQSGEPPKENFIHVRARRGQATNSHSLAERVRREKISERMRLLQELVPGCNKITGKAVMLDEIINYVQSLQQQVEFLSMKLATVNPELNFDVERILSKDILQSRLGHGIGGYGPGISSSHPFPNGSFPGTMAGMPSTSTQFPPFPQAVLDHELQSLYAMGYDSSTALNNLGPNGRLKPEL